MSHPQNGKYHRKKKFLVKNTQCHCCFHPSCSCNKFILYQIMKNFIIVQLSKIFPPTMQKCFREHNNVSVRQTSQTPSTVSIPWWSWQIALSLSRIHTAHSFSIIQQTSPSLYTQEIVYIGNAMKLLFRDLIFLLAVESWDVQFVSRCVSGFA